MGSCPARMRPTPPSRLPPAKTRARASIRLLGRSRPISNTSPRRSLPSRCKRIGAAPGGNRAISAAFSFPHSLSCENASTSATANRTGRSSPAQLLSGAVETLATFDPPTVPKVPKPHSTKKDFGAASFAWVPRRLPAKKWLRHGHSGDLGELGRVKSVRILGIGQTKPPTLIPGRARGRRVTVLTEATALIENPETGSVTVHQIEPFADWEIGEQFQCCSEAGSSGHVVFTRSERKAPILRCEMLKDPKLPGTKVAHHGGPRE